MIAAKLDGVKTYMRMRRVPNHLQVKVIKWFDYLWLTQKCSDEEKAVSCLPGKFFPLCSYKRQNNSNERRLIWKTTRNYNTMQVESREDTSAMRTWSFFFPLLHGKRSRVPLVIFSISDLWKLNNAINANVISYFYMDHLSSLHPVVIVINAQYRRAADANLLS